MSESFALLLIFQAFEKILLVAILYGVEFFPCAYSDFVGLIKAGICFLA